MPIFRLPRSTRPAIPADPTAKSRYSSANLTCSKKMNACVGYFDSGMMPIEQVDAQKVLKFHYALADAGLANAKRLRRAAKIECSATVKAWITEVSSIFGFTKVPLNVGEGSRAGEPLRPRVGKRESLKIKCGLLLCAGFRSTRATRHKLPGQIRAGSVVAKSGRPLRQPERR